MNDRKLVIEEYKEATQKAIAEINNDFPLLERQIFNVLNFAIETVRKQDERIQESITRNEASLRRIRTRVSDLEKMKKDLDTQKEMQQSFQERMKKVTKQDESEVLHHELMKIVLQIEDLTTQIKAKEALLKDVDDEIKALEDNIKNNSELLETHIETLKNAESAKAALWAHIEKNEKILTDLESNDKEKLGNLSIKKDHALISNVAETLSSLKLEIPNQYKLITRWSSLDKMVFFLNNLLDSRNKEEFKEKYDHITKDTEHPALVTLQNDLMIIRQNFRTLTAKEAIRDQILLLIKNTQSKLTPIENGKGKNEKTIMQHTLSAMYEKSKENDDIPGRLRGAYTIYVVALADIFDPEITNNSYKDWFSGVKEFDEQLFKLRLLSAGIEYTPPENTEIDLPILTKYETVKNSIPLGEKAERLEALIDCLKQKQMQLNILINFPKEATHIIQLQNQIESLSSQISAEIENSPAAKQTSDQLVAADKIVKLCRTKSNASLEHLLGKFSEQLKELNREELVAVFKTFTNKEEPKYNNNKTLINMIKEEIRKAEFKDLPESIILSKNNPQEENIHTQEVNKIYAKVHAMKSIITTLHQKNRNSFDQLSDYRQALTDNAETLELRRDGKLMALLKNSGEMGFKIYKKLNDSVFFRPHGKKYLEEAKEILNKAPKVK